MSKASNFLTEFKKFAVKGNMMDLAVGVIIGAAFGKIIDSLVKDIFMPVISFLVGGKVDFSNMFVVLSAPEGLNLDQPRDALVAAGANILGYGNFITILINFILLAFVVFILVKVVAKARANFEEPPAPPAPAADPADIALLKEIRDLLKNK
ncbi:large conductance mechanosensitive channel protein MscL [Basilea psittacipulmonis]|uniref:Large-conductance mechanosensitive channel n=1 Tax=Basilea psittacipulmonis DSM 24701 TaxID=1072685 RepID=A0A077DFW1_9BURK|nr:large conductance mechanosensitive channel protein MscL [Basilea psittacipulmonis]AIL32063.1 large-conductance mechanosensitive channel [Basilea psittacipulmonis DSM 24701]